jgi:hypothetical protein
MSALLARQCIKQAHICDSLIYGIKNHLDGTMARIDEKFDEVLVQRELLRSSKCIAKPFEAAYQWMKQQDLKLDSRETVGTIAFTGNGHCKVNHVTWSDLVDVHNAYDRLDSLERLLKARWAEKQYKAEKEQGELEYSCMSDHSKGETG